MRTLFPSFETCKSLHRCLGLVRLGNRILAHWAKMPLDGLSG